MTQSAPSSLFDFLKNSPFRSYLESCWNGEYYLSFPVATGKTCYDSGGINAHVLFYHIYGELLGLNGLPAGRAAALAVWLAGQVQQDGRCESGDGVTDHPAVASTIADALGTAVYYADKIGLDGLSRDIVMKGLENIAVHHLRIRFPEGAQGKTQQLRFELRVYYWMALLSGDEEWRRRFDIALNNGIHRYTHTAAIDGPLVQPSINPDWTWNYVCTGGLTDQHSTNTHTPAYYCTEPNGFMFVYLHALKNKIFERREDFDKLNSNYIRGLIRNLSRAGHLASDLDGYGIHRAWFSPVLIEGIPLESAALAAELGLPEMAAYCRWYVDRYIDFVQRSPSYGESGLPEAQPYGHRINIEAQFSQLAGARFYGSIARALYEFGQLNELAPVEPPAYGSFAWDAGWLRVSTPHYETSFAGHTCLRNIPVVPCYGDPNLGTLIGGSPLATLFSKHELLYAASFPAVALWHIEVDDHNGRRFLSCSTSPEDETSLAVRHSSGEILDSASFNPYDQPCNLFFGENDHLELNYQRRERANKFKFYVRNRYYADHIDLDFGMIGMAGHYYDKISFILPIPEPVQLNDIPQEIRWGNCRIDHIELEGAGDKLVVKTEKLPETPGMPGGLNSFSPFPTRQVRFEITPDVKSRVWRFRCRLNFD